MTYHFKILLIFITLILSGCTTSNYISNANNLGKFAESRGFKKQIIKGGKFWLTVYQRITSPSDNYVFYIEGDGYAFDKYGKITDNPTPRNLMLIRLAAIDTRPNIVYIARPCQYTQEELNPTCVSKFWTDYRMSQDVVDSINEVITTVNHGGQFSLVGYSGGGGIAVLVASINPNVKDIVTIAGNLDHVRFTEYNRTRGAKFNNIVPLFGSLNPIDYASSVSHIPQIHISGDKDEVTPPFIASEFVKVTNQNNASICAYHYVIDNADHADGWAKSWKDIVNLNLECH
ncbi:MAG: alpha/beta fold hydrolase [Rickettsiaceae bacterium]